MHSEISDLSEAIFTKYKEYKPLVFSKKIVPGNNA